MLSRSRRAGTTQTTLDGSVPEEMVTDLLGDSYDLVVASLPKARRP
jgi:predicted DNA-binding protein (MmcQ/YjbR family)